MREHDWRILISAAGCLRSEGFHYGLDNGAWSAFQAGTSFNVPQFERALDKVGAGADWIILPDIVAGGLPSLDLSLSWIDRCSPLAPLLLLPVQNGMTRADIEPLVSDRLGIFVGGDTADDTQYADCSQSFVASIDAAALVLGVKIKAPLANTTKADILAEAKRCGLTWWSCYTPDDGLPCGECNACSFDSATIICT